MATSAKGRAATKRTGAATAAGAEAPNELTARHQELIDAAAVVFHRKGYNGASIQDIADVLGILKGSVYYYVKSKEDLLFAVINEIHESALATMSGIDTIDASPRERIAEFVRRHVLHSADHIERATVFFRDFSALSPDRRAKVLGDRERYTSLLTGLIIEAKDAGVTRPDIDVRMVVLAILGMTNWTYQWYRPGGPYTADEIAEKFAGFALDMIGATRGQSTAEATQASRTSAGAAGA